MKRKDIPEIVQFLESVLSSEPDEAIDLLTNTGEEVLDRWYEENAPKPKQRTIWASGKDVESGELTPQQWHALAEVRVRHDLTDNVEIMSGIGYIMVRVSDGLVLGIEPDGHPHS